MSMQGGKSKIIIEAVSIRKAVMLAIVSIIAIVITIALSVSIGSRQTTASEILSGVFGGGAEQLGVIVARERIVRTIFSLIAGAALGISGTLMQATTRNPIADPSVLGVNTGASLFVVIGIAFFGINSATQYILLALIGAGVTAIFVYGLAAVGGGGATPIKLALAGAAISAALSSLVTAIMLPRGQVMDVFRFWQIGSVGRASYQSIALVLPFLVVGMVVSLLSAPSLNALALGDDVATGLGINTTALRIINAAAGVMLCGAITALAGPIGFIGLMAPHAVRLMLGADMRTLIPMSAVAGACVLTLSDVVGRIIARPSEVEVGIITAFVGAPILVYTAMKSKVRSL